MTQASSQAAPDHEPAGPLAGVRVLDLSRLVAGNMLSLQLADFGAEVIKLEPDKGDPLRIWLEPGQTYQLPGGRGSISFDSVQRFAGLSIRHDPGKFVTLAAALLALSGLIASLVIRRRRVFVRVSPGTVPGRTVVAVGGLAKGDDDGDNVLDLMEALRRSVEKNREKKAGSAKDSGSSKKKGA